MHALTLDYTNCLAEAIGATHGLTKPEVDTLVAKFPKHHENIDELRSTGESSFFDLPYQDLGELKALIKKHFGRWDNVVVVATGGSALAPASLLQALGHGFHNALDAKERGKAPRVFFCDNPDPKRFHELLGTIDLKSTLFQVITRSGASAETTAMFLAVQDALKKKVGKSALATQMVITTDRDRSAFVEIAKQEKCDTLHMPTNLTGRFAVLGNAGLFAAAMCGLNIDALLKGAADMDKRCRHGDAVRNPAYMHSLIHYLLTRKRRKTLHATYAFSSRLHAVAKWYEHLCSVSLGKMLNRKGKAVHVGPTPVTACGAFDQHGQIQLYAEGPFDKVTTFITARNHGAVVGVPATYPKIDGVATLGNTGFTQLLDHAHIAAEQTITTSGRPNMTIIVDTVNEGAIGGLYYLFMLSTTMSAELYGIDPFDQPGVEHAKQAQFAQLGRSGFEDLAKRIKDYRALPRKTC